MELKGDIENVGLPFVLETISYSKETGTLKLLGDKQEGNIYFRSGKVIFADSSLQKVRLGEILVEQGKITDTEIKSILHRQKKEGKKFGEILREKGKITEEEIAKCLNYQAEEVVFQLLSWTAGQYQFHRDSLPEDLLIDLAEQTSSLITEGKEQIEELLRIRETLPSMDLILELNPLTESRDKDKLVDLTIDEWHILSLIDSNRSVAEICSLSPANTFTTCRILHNLISFDIVIPQTVRLFEETGKDPSEKLLNITAMIAIYNRTFTSIISKFSNEIGDTAYTILGELFRNSKKKQPVLFRSIDLTQEGLLDPCILMQNVLSLPQEQQVQQLRTGLNSFLISAVIQLRDNLGKKKYTLVMKNVYTTISALFSKEDKLRRKLRLNFETAIKHTNQIPSSFELGSRLFKEQRYDEARLEFIKISKHNPEYEKSQKYLSKIAKAIPEPRKPPGQETGVTDEIPKGPEESLDAMAKPQFAIEKTEKFKIAQHLMKALKQYNLENYDEAIKIFDAVLNHQKDNAKAMQYRKLSEKNLAKKYERKFGSLDSIPLLNEAIDDEKLIELTLSPQQGFVLSRVNGSNSLQEVVNITGLEKLDIMKMFNFFLEKEIIKFQVPQKKRNIERPFDVSDTETKPVMKALEVDTPHIKEEETKTQSKSSAQHKSSPRLIDREKLAEQHYRMGMEAYNKGDFIISVEALEAAILNNPNNALYYNLLAEAQEKRRTNESMDNYESGLKELKLKNYSKAIKYLKKAVSSSPRNPKYLMTYAEVIQHFPGKKEEALKYYKKSLELQPNKSKIIIKIGLLYKSLGRKELAIKAFRSCLSVDSSNERALQELRKLQLSH